VKWAVHGRRYDWRFVLAVIVAIAVVASGAVVTTIYRDNLSNTRNDALSINATHVATRIPAGRFGSLDNALAKTFQATFELVDDFDAVRLVFGSNDTSNTINVAAASASAPSSAADANNSGGEWSRVSAQGETKFSISTAANSNRPAILLSDWIPLPSVGRSDGGKYPLLTVRAFFTSTPTLPVIGNGKDKFSNWASRSDGGRKFWWRQQDGDQITSPSGFTSVVNRSQSPILGVQYLSRNQVVSVAAVGDSITEGRGTYLGEGFVLPALEELNAAGSDTKYEYANFGWSGQSPGSYTERTLDIMRSEIKPDVLVMPDGSPNPVSDGVLTDEAVSATRKRLSRVVASAAENGAVLVLWTWLPTNSSVRAYGPSDAKRVAYNAEVIAGGNRDLLIADTATALSGPIIDGQVQMAVGATNDGIHPSDSGNSTLAAIIKPLLVTAAQRLQFG
jgi:lysophospholipase L1-like esterase